MDPKIHFDKIFNAVQDMVAEHGNTSTVSETVIKYNSTDNQQEKIEKIINAIGDVTDEDDIVIIVRKSKKPEIEVEENLEETLDEKINRLLDKKLKDMAEKEIECIDKDVIDYAKSLRKTIFKIVSRDLENSSKRID